MYVKSLGVCQDRGLLNTLDKNKWQRDCIKVQPNVSYIDFFFCYEDYSFYYFFSNVECTSMRLRPRPH